MEHSSSLMAFVYTCVVLLITQMGLYRAEEPPDSIPFHADTTEGILSGFSKEVHGQSMNIFLGVPYAEPPVGPLRFQPPQAVQPWPGRKDATKYRSACLQPPGNTYIRTRLDNFNNYNEDCLYLNIFAPKKRDVTEPGLAVAVFLHGGDWQYGTPQMWEAENFAARGRIIVITVTYRLGLLGFFSTGDGISPGNNGLLDQVKAMQWVKANIHHFHGDAKRVTLFGQKSGADAVIMHMMSSLSKDLFSAAIVHSGVGAFTADIYQNRSETYRTQAKDLGTQMNCPSTETSKNLLDCLKGLSADKLQENTFTWVPHVDGHFIQNNPYLLWNQGQYKKVPMLVSSVTDEGAQYLASMNISSGLTRREYHTTVETFMTDKYPRTYNAVTDAVIYEYTDWAQPTNQSANVQNLRKLLTDVTWTLPSEKLLTMYSQDSNQPMYVSVFGYRSSKDTSPEYLGVPPGSDLLYVFGVPLGQLGLIDPNWTQEDVQISNLVIKLWSQFIKTYNGTYGSFKWTPYSTKERAYMDIHDMRPAMNTHHEPRVLGFWRTYIPSLDATVKAVMGAKTLPQVNQLQDTAQAYKIGMWVMVAVCVLLCVACCVLGLLLCRGYVMKYNMNGHQNSVYTKPITLSMDNVVSYS